MLVECPHCGASIGVKGLGRKRLDIPLKNICESLHVYGSARMAADKLNCSQGYIYKVLKENGVKLRDVIANGKDCYLHESIN